MNSVIPNRSFGILRKSQVTVRCGHYTLCCPPSPRRKAEVRLLGGVYLEVAGHLRGKQEQGRAGTRRQQLRVMTWQHHCRPIALHPPGSVARTPQRYPRGARELRVHTPARQVWWKHSRAAQPSPQTMRTWTKGFLRLRSLLSDREKTQMELRQSPQAR